MDYYVKSVIPIIESNYENFTALERTIADFFMKNQKKVDFSAKEIAKRLFVSEASYRDSQRNADIGDTVSSFINMRKHLRRKIKNSRDTQGRF